VHRRSPFSTALVCAALAAFANATAPAAVDENLARLRAPDPETRVEAVRALLTELDPRIPEAMLPLLTDEGNSIRRLAARAIGSRWWQIPRERVADFVSALQRNAASEFEDEQNMVTRAVGLLTRDYSGRMFARSSNGRWVVYERHGLPCVIDVQTSTEELLGWSDGRSAWLAPAWGNGPIEGSVFWHQQKELAALLMLMNRKESAVAIWRPGTPLRVFDSSELAAVAGVRERQLHFSGGFFTTIKRWRGDELQFEIAFMTVRGDVYTDHTAVLGWNATRDRLRLISHQATKP
jgi:AcrR family transcriptional regulator